MKHKHSANAVLRRKQFAFKADSVAEDGTFKGYASVFGVMDSYREIVAPGAFTESLNEIKASGDPLPMLWQHRSYEPIGGYDTLAEDERGLKCEGWLMVKEIERAREAHALMKRRVVKGLSIGYYVIDDSWNEKDRVRTLKQLELVEISPVTFGANPDALIDEVKTRVACGELPTMIEFERLLREAGFSKTQATVIANRGLKHLLFRSESESDPQGDTTLSMLKSIAVPKLSFT